MQGVIRLPYILHFTFAALYQIYDVTDFTSSGNLSTEFIASCHTRKIYARPYVCSNFTTTSSTLAVLLIYDVSWWPYRRSYQKIIQTFRSSVGHKGCIRYRFCHFLGDMESGEMVTKKFWWIRKFGMVCYDQWNSMCLIMLTWSERCVSVHIRSPINLFLYHWLSISPFIQMMFKVFYSFSKSSIIWTDSEVPQRMTVWDKRFGMTPVATFQVAVLLSVHGFLELIRHNMSLV